MPCTEFQDQIENLIDKIDDLKDMLCRVLKELEENNYDVTGQLPNDIIAWWEAHKMRDEGQKK